MRPTRSVSARLRPVLTIVGEQRSVLARRRRRTAAMRGDIVHFGELLTESLPLVVTRVEGRRGSCPVRCAWSRPAPIIDELTDEEDPPAWSGRAGSEVGRQHRARPPAAEDHVDQDRASPVPASLAASACWSRRAPARSRAKRLSCSIGSTVPRSGPPYPSLPSTAAPRPRRLLHRRSRPVALPGDIAPPACRAATPPW